MPLTPPKLDDRDFKTLFEQARSRIPHYLPEWTDLNESDPGITLLQLQTWLAETILFKLNKLPELNYYKFLELLGVERRVAVAARADVTFMLDEKKLPNISEIGIPKGTLLRVSSNDLPDPVYFETDESLTAINATLSLLVTWASTGQNVVRTDVTLQNDLDDETFLPFGINSPTNSPYLLMGFSSAVPMTRREFGLQIYLKNAPLGPLEATTPADDCGEETIDMTAPKLSWQWYDGIDWLPLDIREDQTQHFRRSGKVYMRIPGQIPAVPNKVDIPTTPMVLPIDLSKVKNVDHTIKPLLNNANPPITTIAELAVMKENDLYELIKSGLSGADEAEKKKQALDMLEDAKRLTKKTTPPLYYWLRVSLNSGYYTILPEIDRILVNTVGVTQVQTVADEVIGNSNGMPNQIMRLHNSPVFQPTTNGRIIPSQPALVLEIDEGSGSEIWQEVPDFAGSTPTSQIYVLNRTTGEIRFGDNRFGKIPRAGKANVVARHYRYGGGRAGNVGSRTIKELVRPIPGVKEVFNLRPAQGGDDEEALNETLMRVPREMRANQRAVTLDDFALLARETPGGQVVRAYAYIRHRNPASPSPNGCATQIHVVVVPRTPDLRPSPNETTIRMVCQYLDDRRLVTTQVTVEGPAYNEIMMQLQVRVSEDFNRGTIQQSLETRIRKYLHPLEGGSDGLGWKFGRDLYYSELLREVMAVPGVLCVDTMQLSKVLSLKSSETDANDAKTDYPLKSCQQIKVKDIKNLITDPKSPWAVIRTYDCCDVEIDEGALIALLQLDVQVEYERGQGS